MTSQELATEASFPGVPGASSMPEWYPDLLHTVAQEVRVGRTRAVAAANAELLNSYWSIGRQLAERESQEGWGAKVVTRLSADIRSRFPGAKGFSPRNLRYMKSFAHAWPDFPMLQAPLATLPWYHQIALLEKLDDAATRLWYAAAAVQHGWSRNVLTHQISTRLHERSGQAITNFASTMVRADSDLAQQATKDPYVFDFLAMAERHTERDLEVQLVKHVEKFLLELGQGFAFVGEQVRLEITGDEFLADLLFYHLKLRCYMVIELKAVKFEPGFLGQLGMYMAAVDDLMAHPDDKPTIGLLLCKEKNSVVAEYALRGFKAPVGIAEWRTSLADSLPEELIGSLPSIETLEAELANQTEGVEG
ncbi:PDDEXK nuclease domain-containing protein [Arthrobacter sp. fls2-241-R2A-200]|uniref:PDDEXK nuclease domain-containing protein n=1 Tax=Arthrobacter sp. fls2-241-R2A-200 TaxID=3040281 RepID=UPI0025505CF0|nr:PDDEXK nuclease domain-containing protein [Arthrobacter sp. fls2-241-R2A-200]